MALSPSERIDTYLEAFQQAYPGQEAPHVSFLDGWFRIKEKGEHEGKMRAEDLEQRRRELVAVVNSREFDLETIAGLASASDQVYKAAKAYLTQFLQPRINACTDAAQLHQLKNEIGHECLNANGFVIPMPAEFDMAFFMKFSELRGRLSA